jgi:TonB family protein
MVNLVPKTLGELTARRPAHGGRAGAHARSEQADAAHISLGPANFGHDAGHASTVHISASEWLARAGHNPRLSVDWLQRRHHLLDDLRALAIGPRPPRLPRKMRFHDPWRPRRYWAVCFSFSSLAHVLFIALPLPIWLATASAPQDVRQPADVTLTWSGPVKDLPSLAPKSPAPKRAEPDPAPAAAAATSDPALPRIDNFSRQTIMATPARPNHPRQMLIQPDAAPEPPRILPALPNIVEWGRATQPNRPRLPISREVLARLRPKTHARRAVVEEAAPALPNQELHTGAISISSNGPNIPKPAMPVPAASVPLAAQRRDVSDTTVPELARELGANFPGASGGDDSTRRIIALSSNPAPPPPSLDLPSGNLAARVAISPLGPLPGPDAGSLGAKGNGSGAGNAASGNGSAGNGVGGNGSGGGSGAGGPGDIFVSRGDPSKTSNIVGPGGGSGNGSGLGSPRGSSSPGPAPRLSSRDLAAGSGLGRGLPQPPGRYSAELGEYVPTHPEEAMFHDRRVYSIAVNMPNLTSVTGSWIVKFAEFYPDGKAPTTPPKGPLAAPDPLRKIDPKYPPALMEARIEGEVVLYAIIRKDGTVDSVQVLRSLEPQLDRNAMEAFTRWQFWPATRNSIPVEIETVVIIPFRAFAPKP